MKKYVVYLGILIAITAIFLYFKDSKKMDINENISNELITVNDFNATISPYVSKYFGHTHYYLGDIWVLANKELKGEIRLTFVSTARGAEIVEVLLDTKAKKIMTLTSLGNDDVLRKNEMFTDEWQIDYAEAATISSKLLNKDADYNQVLIEAVNREVKFWKVRFQNTATGQTYWFDISSKDGTVLDSGSRYN